MGGGGGGKKSSGSAPQQAQPLDYNALMAAASRAAGAQVKAQFKNMVEYYPDMERQQLGSVQNIGTMLGEGGTLYAWKKVEPTKAEKRAARKRGEKAEPRWERVQVGTAAPNEYTPMARAALEQSLGQRGMLDAEAAKLSGIGDWITQTAKRSFDESGPTSIESRLYADAERELALGRSLTPEQQREASQSARAAMAARGLGTSMAGTAAEILNRDAYASAREADRRQFAASANDMQMRNVMSRRDQAAQQASLGAGILSNAAQTGLGSANLGLAGAQTAMAVDPVMRSIAPGLQMGSGIQATMGQIIQPTYANATQMAGNVAAFNASMLDARRAGYLNNQAALQAARISGGAAQNAGWMNMIGGTAQGLGSAAMAFSDKRMKKDIKPVGKDGLLGLKTYEYRFKGEPKDAPKRVGYMAQEVAEVLPEAVEQVDYKGKKRLAIKPQVIGQALAAALTAEQEAMFAEGYTVR